MKYTFYYQCLAKLPNANTEYRVDGIVTFNTPEECLHWVHDNTKILFSEALNLHNADMGEIQTQVIIFNQIIG